MSDTRFGDLRRLRQHLPAEGNDADRSLAAASKLTEDTPLNPSPSKRRNAELERLTTYVRIDTKRAAFRKWQDQTGKDMSDLVELLLRKYLDT
jgi:hypothetical protein